MNDLTLTQTPTQDETEARIDLETLKDFLHTVLVDGSLFETQVTEEDIQDADEATELSQLGIVEDDVLILMSHAEYEFSVNLPTDDAGDYTPVFTLGDLVKAINEGEASSEAEIIANNLDLVSTLMNTIRAARADDPELLSVIQDEEGNSMSFNEFEHYLDASTAAMVGLITGDDDDSEDDDEDDGDDLILDMDSDVESDEDESEESKAVRKTDD